MGIRFETSPTTVQVRFYDGEKYDASFFVHVDGVVGHIHGLISERQAGFHKYGPLISAVADHLGVERLEAIQPPAAVRLTYRMLQGHMNCAVIPGFLAFGRPMSKIILTKKENASA